MTRPFQTHERVTTVEIDGERCYGTVMEPGDEFDVEILWDGHNTSQMEDPDDLERVDG